MRKGFEWSISILFALILAVVAAGMMWAALTGKASAAPAEPVKLTKGCINDNDCLNKVDGSKCLVVYPGDFTSFCGCLTSVNCKVGNCGSDNKCV